VFNVGSATGYLKLNTTGWTSSMRGATAQVTALSRTFARMGAVVVGSLFLIERQFGKFDKAIRHATSVSEASEEQFKQMSEMALDASVKWNKAATSTAQAFYYLGSAGLTVTEQMHTFNDTIMLSRAMGSNLSQTVEGMVDIVRAFGLEFENSGRIADQITKTVISSNQQFYTLSRALSYAASTARLTNNTLAETTAMLGVMANAGIKGSMAGTVLRRAMTNLMSPTGGMAELIYELGLNTYDTTGKMKPFIQIMGEISDRLKGTTDEYKNMVFEMLFGRRAIAGQIVLFNYGSKALAKYANEIQNAAGTTARVAGKQMKAFTEVLGQLWREAQRVAIVVGDLLVPAIERVARRVRDNIVEFRKYIKANKDVIITTLKWGTVLGTIAVIGPPVALVLTSLVTQFVALAAALIKVSVAGLMNPFTILIASLYLLRAQLTQPFWEDAWKGFTAAASNAVDVVKAKFKTLAWIAHREAMMAKEHKLGTPLIRWDATRTALEMELFSEGYDMIAKQFTKLLKLPVEKTAEAAKKAAAVAAAGIKEIYDNTVERAKKDIASLTGLFDVLMANLPASMQVIVARVTAILGGLVDTIRIFMQEPILFKGIKAPRITISEEYEKLYQAIQEYGKEEIAVMQRSIKTATIWEKRWKSGVVTVVKSMRDWQDMFTDVNADIRSAWADTINDVIEKGGTFEDFFENMFTNILSSFNKFASEVLAGDLWWSIFGQGIKRPFGTATFLKGSVSASAPDTGYGAMLDTMSRSVKDIFVPKFEPSEPYIGQFPGEGLQKQAVGKVAINIENKGEPVSLRETGRRFDGKQWVISTVMERMDTDPNFRARFGG